jgi:hypothetical protein
MNNGFSLLNGSEIGYLIHGQPFILTYSFNKYKFLIFYNKLKLPWWQFGRCFSLQKAKGEYHGISNAYNPEIICWGFKAYLNPFAEKLVITLKVNFFNLREQDTSIKSTPPRIINHQLKHLINIPEIQLSKKYTLKEIQGHHFQLVSIGMKLNIEPL